MLDGQDGSLAWTCGTLIVKYIKLSNSCKERKKRFVNVEKFHPILWDIALESRLAIWMTDALEDLLIMYHNKKFSRKIHFENGFIWIQKVQAKEHGFIWISKIFFFFFFGMKEN